MNSPARTPAALAAGVAARHAARVDEDGRFPSEAFEALRVHRLLGSLVPAGLGGGGGTLAQAASVCCTLGQSCGSTALIYAMHQIQVACLVAGAGDSVWHRDFLARVAAEQMLLASVTSEAATGGDIRSSDCALEQAGGRFALRKRAPAISYATQADALLVTARRHAASHASDQVLVVVAREDVRLDETACWDTLGMRGTCSRGFDLEAGGDVAQVLPVPFADVAGRAMLPVSHVLWGAVWLGIAADAVGRARAFLRARVQAAPGATPPGGVRLHRAASLLHTMRARLRAAIEDCAAQEAAAHGGGDSPLRFVAEINDLKLSMSEMAVEAVSHAMQVCGISGYRNATPYSLGRHLRDIQSAPLMVSNDRIAAGTAALGLAQRPSALVL